MFATSEFIAETLEETYTLVNEPTTFMQEAVHMRETCAENIQLRVCKWLQFFLDSRSDCVCLYSATVSVLISASFRYNEMFLEQTEYERDISFSFYKKLFDSKVFLEANEESTARHLLSIALIYGRYPGMQVRPMAQVSKILATYGVNMQSLYEVFECLFIKYENPKVLTHNMVNLSLKEIDALMFTLQGNNISRYPNLPTTISKKESFFLVNMVPVVTFHDEVLKRAAAAARLMHVSTDVGLLYDFMFSCRTFMHRNIDVFLQEIDFWKKAYSILAQAKGNSFLTIQEFVDYFEFHRDKKDFSLRRKTMRSIERDIMEWHGQIGEDADEELLHKTWKRLEGTERIYKIHYGKDCYTFAEITSGEVLAKESEAMKHCVVSYLVDCLTGYSSIWTMKKALGDVLWNVKADPKRYFQHHMTIEVVDRVIVQVAGKHNAPPSKRDWWAIRKWTKEANLQIEKGYYEEMMTKC